MYLLFDLFISNETAKLYHGHNNLRKERLAVEQREEEADEVSLGDLSHQLLEGEEEAFQDYQPA